MKANASNRKRSNHSADPYQVNLDRGLSRLKDDRLDEALLYLEKAAKVRPDQPELLFILANAYQAAGDAVRSEEIFGRLVKLEPDNFEYLHDYGLLLQSSGQIDRSVELLHRAADLQPRNHELLNDLGVLHYQLQEYDAAMESLTRAAELNPGYTLALVNGGYVHLAQNDLPGAHQALEQASIIDPDDPEVKELRRRVKAAGTPQVAPRPEIHTRLTFSDRSFEISPLELIKNFGETHSLEQVGLSIVIPVFNEEENLPILYAEITETLSMLQESYEIIFIDDGSVDGSREVLAEIAGDDSQVKIIQFRRNYGQTAALSAGFKFARGSVVITMDADLQNDPADIPRLLEKMAEGYDLVSGWRKDRKDKLVTRKIPSRAANKLINKLIEGTGVQLHDFGCTLKAYKRGIIKNIHLYGEMHRFIPTFAAWLGVRVTEIPVNHRPRVHGEAKYGLSRVSRVIFDLIVVRFFTDYMTRPIQFFGKIAKKMTIAGLLIIASLIILSLTAVVPLSAGSIIILTALLLFAVLQIISIGLLGELMVRSYFETQKKDYYNVEKIINVAESD